MKALPINKDNFYYFTKASFTPCAAPTREPDFMSTNQSGEISSAYWYSEQGLVRFSNHWGQRIKDCSWAISSIEDSYSKAITFTQEPVFAYVPWKSMKRKYIDYNALRNRIWDYEIQGKMQSKKRQVDYLQDVISKRGITFSRT